MQAIEWVGTSATIAMGSFRSVRITVAMCKTVLVRVLVFKQDDGLEITPQ
jgi:hypothetical protein